jgi:type I restriction enzyme S subunit
MTSRYPLCRLRDVMAPTQNRDPGRNGKPSFRYVDIASVSNKSFSILEAREISSAHAPSRARKIIRKGDVILATTRPYLINVALVPPELDNEICSTGFCVLRCGPEIDPEWAFYFCTSHLMMDQLTPVMRGANYPAVTDRDVLNAEIPLPSLAEQHQVLTRIKDCVERLQEIERLEDSLVPERLLLGGALIEGALLSSNGVDVVLGDVAKVGSELVDPTLPEHLDKLHVGGANIESKTGKLLDVRSARQEKLKSAKFPFSSEMVLYNKIRPYLVKVARPSMSGICSADMYPLLPDRDRLMRDYLFYQLMSRGFTDYAISGSNRAGMPKVNREHLFAYRFNLQSLDKQAEVILKLDRATSALEKARETWSETTKGARLIRQSIIAKAFEGEL